MTLHQILDRCNADAEDNLRAVRGIISQISSKGIESTTPEDRCVLFRGMSTLPVSTIDSLSVFPSEVIKQLYRLRASGNYTFSRISSIVLDSVADQAQLFQLGHHSIPDGPAVIFVANMGSQVPTPRPTSGAQPTLGYRLRKRRGLVPPFGLYYVASYFAVLGIEVRVFNLALGESEVNELEHAIDDLGDRLWFVSFASNFFGEAELTSVSYIAAVLNRLQERALSPQFVAGGMGAYFQRETYLNYTPIKVVIGRYGEPSFADMIFESGYKGPVDDRVPCELYGQIPNLHFLDKDKNYISTRIQPLAVADRRVLANSFDLSMVPYEKKYWSTGLAIAICSPDDLNIPSDLGFPQADGVLHSDGSRKTTATADDSDWHPVRSVDFPLHPANYLFRPKGVKIMTTFGNCPRGCKFCQFTKFDEKLFFISAERVVDKFNQALEAHPEAEMLLIDDDDFLIKRKHIDNMVTALEGNRPTQGKVFYVETTPMDVERKVLRSLRNVGFRAVLLGIESPVERIARHVGKLLPRHSFDHFVTSPRLTFEEGFYTRVTSIPFYPIINEFELLLTIERLTEYINFGAAVSIFPLVKALPGTDFANSSDHQFTKTRLPIAGANRKHLDILEYVLPDDLVVRDVAFRSLSHTSIELQRIIDANRITTDYPMSLGVLAFFKSVLAAMVDSKDREVSDSTIGEIESQVESTISRLVRKHFVQLSVQATIRSRHGRSIRSERNVEDWLHADNKAYALLAMRMILDFGAQEEVAGAATLVTQLASNGVADELLESSLRHCAKRNYTKSNRMQIDAALDRLAA